MNIKHLALAALLPAIAYTSDKVIYGEDGRHDPYSYHDQSIIELSRSTVALMKASDLKSAASGFRIARDTLSQSHGICADERFAQQPTAAFCSGFLIAPNKIVTAGHCITDVAACNNVRFVFDYKMNDELNAQTTFSQSQVYSCKQVLGQVLERSGRDFAVIELDRPVLDRSPLKLSTNTDLQTADEIFVIGHPSGLPTKITDGAVVREVKKNSGFFTSNLDTYGGNSGSAVFNARTLEVEGILVRGETDYVSNGSCRSSNRIGNTEGRGEDVTLISVIHERGFEAEPVNTSRTVRYVWLDSDNTCNEFHGDEYIREVADSFCAEGPATGALRYVWLDSDNTCNEFRGDRYIREVADSFCAEGPATGASRYVWLDSDNTCNEFRGDRYIREVANSYCGRGTSSSGPSTGTLRYVWLDSDSTCNEFHGGDYIREVSNSYCGRN